MGYAYRRKVEAYARCSQVTGRAVKQLAEVISRNLERLQEVSERCKVMTRLTETQLSYFSASHNATIKTMETLAGASVTPDKSSTAFVSGILYFIQILSSFNPSGYASLLFVSKPRTLKT